MIPQDVLDALRTYEGATDYMYADHLHGKVTVGVGLMLPNAHAAVLLPFVKGVDEVTGKFSLEPASDDEKTAAWNAVRQAYHDKKLAMAQQNVQIKEENAEIDKENQLIAAHKMTGTKQKPLKLLKPGNVSASYYEDVTTIRLTSDVIDAMLIKKVQEFLKYLRHTFKKANNYPADFNDFPLAAQEALLDLMYNLGPGNFAKRTELLNAIADDLNWPKAAEQSHRSNVQAKRNTYVRGLFTDLKKGEKLGPSTLPLE
jgi:GH24 family phage-related lysozyme (muramidase)